MPKCLQQVRTIGRVQVRHSDFVAALCRAHSTAIRLQDPHCLPHTSGPSASSVMKPPGVRQAYAVQGLGGAPTRSIAWRVETVGIATITSAGSSLPSSYRPSRSTISPGSGTRPVSRWSHEPSPAQHRCVFPLHLKLVPVLGGTLFALVHLGTGIPSHKEPVTWQLNGTVSAVQVHTGRHTPQGQQRQCHSVLRTAQLKPHVAPEYSLLDRLHAAHTHMHNRC